MKLLISNQHGAIVMALMPFIYGMLLSTPIWQHGFLLLAWFSLYLMTYPFLNLFKGRNLELYKKWTVIYFSAVIIFAIPAVLHNWRILYFAIAIILLSPISIYYVKRKDERSLLNDFNGILIFAIAGMCSYYFANSDWDEKIYWIAIYPSLFFIGTTFYVKSMMRERKNPVYLRISIVFHLACIVMFACMQQYLLALAFIVPFIRAIWLPHKKLSIKQVGLIEMGVSLCFFIMLLCATL
ncbi:YwiC-like family protein [Pasteurella bettyae]|uniref:Putative membrane protein n=1 Tax=Pasteurella bettyae CCUG 2042 TaxID=1095749 RepID=I3DEJ5_9PAST|nr:YwiC-like family protein [Pasteurella bettyae]EIJ70138.1 putative membrane protein [Pasteurella bettyae CCUG 2042]SUB21973.1 transmembrane protein [Pasteurella bettyae]